MLVLIHPNASRIDCLLTRLYNGLVPSTKVITSLLLTLSEAAGLLRLSDRTLQRMVASGEFPAPLKLRGATRVPLADVEGYVAKLIAQRRAAP